MEKKTTTKKTPFRGIAAISAFSQGGRVDSTSEFVRLDRADLFANERTVESKSEEKSCDFTA